MMSDNESGATEPLSRAITRRKTPEEAELDRRQFELSTLRSQLIARERALAPRTPAALLRPEEQPQVRPSEHTVDLSRELRWIEEHRSEYAGQWVAVRGDRLLSSGPNGKEVYEAARAAGDECPFVTRVEPADELPFAGW